MKRLWLLLLAATLAAPAVVCAQDGTAVRTQAWSQAAVLPQR